MKPRPPGPPRNASKMIPARGPQTKLKEIPGLRRHGDERTCQQVLRVKHLLTMHAFGCNLGKRASQQMPCLSCKFEINTSRVSASRISVSPHLRISASPHLRISASPHLRISLSPYLLISLSPYLLFSVSRYLLISHYLFISLSHYLVSSLARQLVIS